MNTYQKTKSYRQIYKEFYGEIPKDSNDRTFDIHHIDGDHSNNSPDNLKAVSLQEHYDIHYSQCDWNACQAILVRMNQIPEKISKTSSELQKRRLQDGTHPWANPNHGKDSRERCLTQVRNGTHAWMNSNHQRETALRRAKEGTLPGQMASKNGTHNFFGGEIQRVASRKRVKDKTHHLLGPTQNKNILNKGIHPSQTKVSCLCCGKVVSVGNFSRHISGTKCK